MTRLRADLLLLLASLIWGGAFVGQSTAMAHMGPFSFIGARFVLASLALLPFALAEARNAPNPLPLSRVPALIGIGAIFFGGVAFQQVGLLLTSVTHAGFLTALYVVMVPAIGAVFLRHKLPAAIWPAAALSLFGTFLLGGGRIDGLGWGDGLLVIGALFWAAQIIALGRLAYDLRRPVMITLMQFAVAAALGLGIGFAVESPSLDAALLSWRELAYTGFISGGIAFTLQSIAQTHTPPADSAILLSLESLFAAAFGALLLGERLTPAGWTGGAMVLAAAILVQVMPLMKRA
ncbi:EamA family transporter [Parvibaculum sedimenti]|uniref:EamA family transporter n=1 Tax=Parvibaculum sedimenti TaxID=2608632 RepID=A0A6N6VFK5_9HYPH|nr:DMT family transporter [Parvibaculum sedimenti]KAB7739414.1 EamA family transporter [Parvibaculum sedimenti]